MGEIYVIFIDFLLERNGTLLSTLKGNNSCKTCNFRIKVGNVQMLYQYCWKKQV